MSRKEVSGGSVAYQAGCNCVIFKVKAQAESFGTGSLRQSQSDKADCPDFLCTVN